jgi:hypothetical protein
MNRKQLAIDLVNEVIKRTSDTDKYKTVPKYNKEQPLCDEYHTTKGCFGCPLAHGEYLGCTDHITTVNLDKMINMNTDSTNMSEAEDYAFKEAVDARLEFLKHAILVLEDTPNNRFYKDANYKFNKIQDAI